jgi:hypothetical protein
MTIWILIVKLGTIFLSQPTAQAAAAVQNRPVQKLPRIRP